jgi:hypothetical protein
MGTAPARSVTFYEAALHVNAVVRRGAALNRKGPRTGATRIPSGRWRSRAAFYSRLSVVSCERPRLMMYAGVTANLAFDRQCDQVTERVHTRLVAMPFHQPSGAYAATDGVAKVDSSRQIANKIRLKRRASAVTAMRFPRRRAS